MLNYDLPELTIYQALYIKYLRVKLDGSWRYVATKFQDRYERELSWNAESDFNGNQIIGMQLCSAAMILLNEKVEDGWN